MFVFLARILNLYLTIYCKIKNYCYVNRVIGNTPGTLSGQSGSVYNYCYTMRISMHISTIVERTCKLSFSHEQCRVRSWPTTLCRYNICFSVRKLYTYKMTTVNKCKKKPLTKHRDNSSTPIVLTK